MRVTVSRFDEIMEARSLWVRVRVISHLLAGELAAVPLGEEEEGFDDAQAGVFVGEIDEGVGGGAQAEAEMLQQEAGDAGALVEEAAEVLAADDDAGGFFVGRGGGGAGEAVEEGHFAQQVAFAENGQGLFRRPPR